MRITRRRLLAAGAAAAGTMALGAALVADGYRGWIVRFLRKALPGHEFDQAGLDRFVAEFKAGHRTAAKFQLLGAAESIAEARSLLPKEKADYVEREERLVLTEFLLGSDFFQGDAGRPRTIAYSGRIAACRSPFARFDA